MDNLYYFNFRLVIYVFQKKIATLFLFPDPQFEGLTLEKWTEMLDNVELHDPSQLQIAGLVASQFAAQAKEMAASLELENVNNVFDDESSNNKSDKIYQRTDQEQKAYDRQELDYVSARKLLNDDGLKLIEKPRYLVKRWVSNFEKTLLFGDA